MKQKIGLFLCLALLLAGCSYQTKTIRFGAADIGGMYYTVANAYAGLASKESSDLKFEVKTPPDLLRICGFCPEITLILESRRRI